MPTVKEYKDDPGYYIRARPPDTGNINYKIKSEAYPIIEGYGLGHGDEITWDMIRSMKSLGFIYTDGSGVLDVGEFEPDPEQLEQTSLSEQQANDLLETIQEHYHLGPEQLETVCSILGIEILGLDTERIQNSLKKGVSSLINSENFLTKSTLKYDSLDEVSVAPLVQKSEDQDGNDELKMSINLISTADIDNSDYLNLLCHSINVSYEQGIDEWLVGFSDNRSWDAKSEITQQVSHLIPVFINELESLGIDPGDPEELPEPDWRNFTDVPF